ncbi:MAG TPA: glycine cleavage system aminomethyltransferase GcvT [Rhodocyclaceae bacterium]|nr:glycine cleavage system aminomethyltransferase GcvT [Rhodocyclaceae bacterium]
MGNRTPLYASHVAAAAKIVDFAGWDMPIHYGSQLNEHHAVRADAGMFDVSHMLAIDLEGVESTGWLRALLANDVRKLGLPGKALYSCMLREDGGVIDDLIVYFLSPTRFRIVVNAGTAAKDLQWMQDHAAGSDLRLTPRRDLAMIAVQGPRARDRCWDAFPASRSATQALAPFQGTEAGGWFVARTGYTGEDGFELTLPAEEAAGAWQALAAAGVRPCGLGARDTLRLEAGMNLYGQDMDETVSPLESGLAWTVDLRDPDRRFVGRRALESAAPARELVGLVLEDKGVLRAHQRIFTDRGPGETTSGSYAPTLERSIAFARVPAGCRPGETVQVEIRDKRLTARVVRPPFARHGKALV